MIDVLVAGGGPAGCAAALFLAKHGFSVTLADAETPRDFKIGETVPPDIQKPLREIGALQSFLDDSHPCSPGICSIWGDREPVYRDGFNQPLGGGWRLDRARFDASLLDQVGKRGIDVLRRTRVVDAERAGQGWNVTLAGSEMALRADFLIDATGRSGSLSRRLGASRFTFDTLIAAYALLPMEEGRRGHAVIEATEEGWWYAADLGHDRAVVALFTDADLARRQRLSDAATWRRLYRQTTQIARHDVSSTCQKIGIAPAATHIMSQTSGPGWLAVGDAASSWDPLKSAGITLALRSGIEGAQAVIRYCSRYPNALPEYDSQLRRRFTQYLVERRQYYAIENRWPASVFWSRRSNLRAA
jgi:flavin-dependent dehydrogenase